MKPLWLRNVVISQCPTPTLHCALEPDRPLSSSRPLLARQPWQHDRVRRSCLTRSISWYKQLLCAFTSQSRHCLNQLDSVSTTVTQKPHPSSLAASKGSLLTIAFRWKLCHSRCACHMLATLPFSASQTYIPWSKERTNTLAKFYCCCRRNWQYYGVHQCLSA